ncbi:MAG: tRNA 4-thiouridine(8) synthase ThiI, partial [Lentisphaerae bacterium]|nr:tRNA 4-thiouridine(8) synthase ThiI [Lentisphaerota bacterium]
MYCEPTESDKDGCPPRRKARGVHLLSGGLDSQLAACVLREQGVEVLCVVFQSLFFDPAKGRQAAERLGFPLLIEDFNTEILALLRHAPHGFGSALNPCIDCHINMIRRAGAIMRERGLDFVSTGEVLNQRPMSQNPKALRMVARDSGLEDLLLRPLSAQLLPAIRPEREQLIDRARLLNIEGRSRKRQIALAQYYGIHDYPQPAGGCLLTEPNYARRLRNLRDHEGLEDRVLIQRLRLGRHFRMPDSHL